MAKFAVGNVVALKSAPKVLMTVRVPEVVNHPWLTLCMWFDANHKLHQEQFPSELLNRIRMLGEE